MEIADRLLRDGDLPGARSRLVDIVRADPGNPGARMFLFSILAVGAEWEKARTQLNALASLSPEARMLSIAYGQAIDAEAERVEVFAGRARAIVHSGGDWTEALVDSLHSVSRADGDVDQDEVQHARARALDAAPDTPGEIDGTRFEWIADVDARFGPTFEAIIGGRYGLVAFDAVERMTSEGPRDLRDVVWYPVQIALRSGHSIAALLPARYPGLGAADAAERLGRATGWTDGLAGQQGSGQHLWMLPDEEDRGLLSVRSLIFD